MQINMNHSLDESICDRTSFTIPNTQLGVSLLPLLTSYFSLSFRPATPYESISNNVCLSMVGGQRLGARFTLLCRVYGQWYRKNIGWPGSSQFKREELARHILTPTTIFATDRHLYIAKYLEN